MGSPSVPFNLGKKEPTFFSSEPNNFKRKRNKRQNVDPKIASAVAVLERRRMRNDKEIKYFDTYLSATNSTTTVGYQQLTTIPQGVGQSNRLGDTVWLQKVDVRVNLTTANTDIFSTMRWGIFHWKQNTASVTPGATSIYESAATFGTLSPANFQGRQYYDLVLDRIENMVGTAGAPTTSSQVISGYSVNLLNRRLDFEVGATTGTGHIYFVNYSDSALVPHPVYTMHWRVWYYDD